MSSRPVSAVLLSFCMLDPHAKATSVGKLQHLEAAIESSCSSISCYYPRYYLWKSIYQAVFKFTP